MPPSWHPVPACVRHGHSAGGAILTCSYDGAAGGPFLAAAAKTLHRFSSLALKSRIDARWLCDYDLQAKPFSVAAKKISIGRGPHCCYDRSRRNNLLDCFQLLVLVLVVLVYLRLKPELFLINSSLFVLSAFLIMTLIIVTNLNYSSTHTTFGGATFGLVVSENLILVLFVHFESPAIKSMIF